MIDLARVKDVFIRLKTEMQKVIVGQDPVLNLILTGMLAKGHILLEGVPGTAKTLTVKTLAQIIGAKFQRLQMTPDLMPSDIIGTNIFDQRTATFQVQKGPIFADLVLVDEINRAPAKTQSALLECMEERQITIEGQLFPLPPLFMVLATQNPLEYEGTYPLPEAQLDRFLFKGLISYPEAKDENLILERYESGFRAAELKKVGLESIVTLEEMQECQAAIALVKTKPALIDYLSTIVRTTRATNEILVGGGVRASISLLLASKANALIEGRDFVTPDDVKLMTAPVLRHRLILKPETEIEGISTDEILKRILNQVKVPR